jgi:hypothetical protein
VICWSSIREFDGDKSSTLHASVFSRGATGLRCIAWAVIDKGTKRYVSANDAPMFTIAWVPAEQITDEASNATQIDAALGNPDQIPLVVVDGRQQRPTAYISDSGSPFPVVGIKGQAMVLAVRVEGIAAGTHGQLTFGWEGDRC